MRIFFGILIGFSLYWAMDHTRLVERALSHTLAKAQIMISSN